MTDGPTQVEPTDEMVDAVAAKLREGTGQDTTWAGDCLEVARSALSAALAVDPMRGETDPGPDWRDLYLTAIEVGQEMVNQRREQVQKLTEENERLECALKDGWSWGQYEWAQRHPNEVNSQVEASEPGAL